ncbi:hypothetical protein EJB05_08644 [Eragrostis curvula]|uniref:Enhancer of polycomb-like protein n=1 Tax=Eragrostis curvula TaxID=38414 RepID=A0A5J9W4L5_9POAL|nr:hypothetical protein EJB05_08644 [Eragrostis curvula]
MPAVGARRSTRVFMPKAPKPPLQDQVDPATRVLPGKRLAADRILWDDKDAVPLNVDDNDHDRVDVHSHHQQQQLQPEKEAPKPELPPLEKDFRFVYSRKRRPQRQPAEHLPEKKGRFGIVYTRRGKRPKVAPIRQEPEPEPEAPRELAAAIPCSSSQEFVSSSGFLDAHFSALVKDVAPHAGAVTVLILVDTSSSRSSHRLKGLLLPVLRWMGRGRQRHKVRNLASFVSSLSVASAFASQGLHFVKLQRRQDSALLQRSLLHCGWCVLHGAKKFGPLLSVNFSALPSYFQRLHSAVAFGSMYLPAGIRESTLLVGAPDQIHPRIHLDVNSGSQCTRISKPTVDLGRGETRLVVQDDVPLEQVAGVVVHGMRLKKHQRKRSSMRHPRNRWQPTARLSETTIGRKLATVLTQTELKVPSTRQAIVEPVQPNPALEISLDLLENLDESYVSTPKGSTRKRKRSSLKSHVGLAAAIPSSSQEFASRTGFLDAHFSALVEDVAPHSMAVTLVILVDTSCSRSSHHLMGLLLPVLQWIGRSCQQAKVRSLASFVSSLSVAPAFASQGLHFIKLQRRRDSALLHRTLAHCGWCVLHGAKKSGPLLSVNFSALPSYFQRLHSAVAFGSMYLPAVIRESMLLFGAPEQKHPHINLDVNSGSQCTGVAKSTADLGSDETCRVVQDYMPLDQAAGVVVHGLRLKKHQRKRSSMRHPRNRRRHMARLSESPIGRKLATVVTQTEVKLPSTGQATVEPVHPKPALEISLDLLENLDESDVSTPMGSTTKQKRSSLKSPVDRMNERLALAEVRQNIDSVRCKANLLVIRDDRCWREEGAEVMLELSDTNEWCIVVKTQGVTRYSLKPSDPRLNGINRYTHASMWAIDDAWKLEFSDKWDWLLFRELHNQGRERNSQGKTIPIPGVHDVPDVMDGVISNTFSRPVPDYIRMVDGEIKRALSKESIYDMDSEDERWLIEFNSAGSVHNNSQRISFDDFEKLMTTFEKDAYSNPETTHDVGQPLSRNPSLGRDDNMLAVYEYWTNKRSKRGAPLIRIFQGVQQRQGQLSQKTSVKRKRSFKRPRIQAGRGKPDLVLQDNAEEEAALQRVAQAEAAAKQAVEKAARLRSRAQSLMENAELATYKSVMALRIAEAARISGSSRDLVSTILD